MELLTVTADDLSELENASPLFTGWAWEMLCAGKIDLFVKGLIAAGQARTKKEALAILVEQCAAISRKGRVMWSDIEGVRSAHNHTALRRLEELVRQEPLPRQKNYQLFGVKSHALMPLIFSGELFEKRPQVQANQLPLFENFDQDFLFGYLSDIKSSPIEPSRVLTRAAYERMAAAWWQLKTIIEEEADWSRWYFSSGKEIEMLMRALDPFLGPYLLDLRRYHSPDHLIVLTAMIWTMVLHLYRKYGTRAYFTEVQIFQPLIHGIGGGRIDAIEVSSIRGKAPRKSQQQLLRQMAKHRFSSLPELLTQLRSFVGKDIQLQLLDWKFSIGDGGMKRIIKPGDVQEAPLSKHASQMRRYLTFVSMSDHLAHGGALWDRQGSPRGSLVYLLPTAEPIEHSIEMTPTDREQEFIRQVVSRWNMAKDRAQIRELNVALANQVIGFLDTTKASGRGNVSSESRLPLLSPTSPAPIVEVIEQHRFLDSEKIIERKLNGRLSMHLDHLLFAIEKGVISVSSFNRDRGGLVTCPMPDHPDPGPSCYIYLSEGHFKCFGCNAFGHFDLNSIPEEFEVDTNYIRSEKSQKVLLEVSHDHHQFMAEAQAVLQRSFRGSSGERYLEKVRCIDGEFAYAHGAGFGTSNLISDLLDLRSLDELIHYGLIGISSNVKAGYSLPRLLMQRGFTEDQVRRPLPSALKGAPTKFGLPYSVLDQRITFPLTYRKKITNFYGRSVRSNAKQPHIKLSNRYTRVLHGGFNLNLLYQPGDTIFVAEAVIDALTLCRIGKSAIALIGVNNAAILQALAKSKKDLGLVLDNDDSGRKSTTKILDSLRRLGFQGIVRDSTSEIVPESYKDVNEWWIKIGCVQYKI